MLKNCRKPSFDSTKNSVNLSNLTLSLNLLSLSLLIRFLFQPVSTKGTETVVYIKEGLN